MEVLTQNRFEGGISPELRNRQVRGILRRSFAFAKHFDIHRELGQLIPHKEFEDDVGSTFQLRKFLTIDGLLYSYGQTSNKAKVYEKNDAADPTSIWDEAPTGEDSTGNRDLGCFIAYKGVIFGGSATNRLWAYELSSNTFTTTAKSLTSYTTLRQGVVHPSDDILYIPHDNKITKKDDLTDSETVTANWTVGALVLPSSLQITSIAPYGEFLAIAARPVGGASGRSRLFLWDRVSTDVTENIDWGDGNLELIGIVEGTLVGVSHERFQDNDSVGNGFTSITIKLLGAGNTPQTVKIINVPIDIAANPTVNITDHVEYKGDKMFFGASIQVASAVYLQGLWSIGRKTIVDPLAVNLEYVNSNITPASQNIAGFFFWGDYTFMAYGAASGNTTVERSANGVTSTEYSETAIFETDIFTGGDSSQEKGLKGTSVSYLPLKTGQQVILKYRKNEDVDDGAWIEIFTRDADNELGHEDIVTIFDFNEVQFRIESTGGAIITQFKFGYDKGGSELS